MRSTPAVIAHHRRFQRLRDGPAARVPRESGPGRTWAAAPNVGRVVLRTGRQTLPATARGRSLPESQYGAAEQVETLRHKAHESGVLTLYCGATTLRPVSTFAR